MARMARSRQAGLNNRSGSSPIVDVVKYLVMVVKWWVSIRNKEIKSRGKDSGEATTTMMR